MEIGLNMKPELQRIETALHQLAQDSSTDSRTASATMIPPTESVAGHQENNLKGREPSFSISVETFPADKHHSPTPSLPKFKPAQISEHRHSANPALAMNLLKDIQKIVGSWQKELQTIVREIQDIYMAGPIVDGWLESHPRQPQDAMTEVRRAEMDRLMDYVAEAVNQLDAKITYESPRTGYRLCGLDSDGKSWARPCPPEQVPSISVAIARYHKLRQLLNRKQELETRLSQLSETLAMLHSHVSNV